LNYLLTLDDVIASRGGIPLVEGGKLIGAIGAQAAPVLRTRRFAQRAPAPSTNSDRDGPCRRAIPFCEGGEYRRPLHLQPLEEISLESQ
jgi:hypothetical protein